MSVVLVVLPWVLAAALVVGAGTFPEPGTGRRTRWTSRQILAATLTVAGVVCVRLLTGGSIDIAIAPIDGIAHTPPAWAVAVSTALIYAGLWSCCQCAFLVRRQAWLADRLKEAEIRRLRSQIAPHFLYNTLNAISELGYEDPKVADHLVTQLSSLLRKILDDSRLREVTLRDEIDFLRRYLDIHKVLMRDRLEVALDIDPRAVNARVPAMIVQPLAENAVTHGIGQNGIGRIGVRAAREGDSLVVCVEDDGAGLQSDGGRRESGIGLSNTRDRLEHLYGRDARLELRNRPNGGLTARMVIPFHEAFAFDEALRPDR